MPDPDVIVRIFFQKHMGIATESHRQSLHRESKLAASNGSLPLDIEEHQGGGRGKTRSQRRWELQDSTVHHIKRTGIYQAHENNILVILRNLGGFVTISKMTLISFWNN